MSARYLVLLGSLAAGLAWLTPCTASAFSDMFIFGDSFSDTGNNAPDDVSGALSGSFGYDPDRWTNAGGTLWSETLAAGLGLAPAAVASSDGGHNYAVGGARADDLLGPAGQIAAFSGAVGGSADPGALYVVFAGGNDMLQGQDATTAAAEVRDAILSLSALGAQQFLVGNVPDFSPMSPGTGPLAGTVPIPGGADVWAADFNSALAGFLAGLVGPTIYNLDIAGIIDPLIDDPVGNGFSAGLSLCSTDASCVGGVGTSNFLLHDHVHFTSATHDIIGAAAIAAVPEPSTGLLVATGLIAFGMRRRGSRHRKNHRAA